MANSSRYPPGTPFICDWLNAPELSSGVVVSDSEEGAESASTEEMDEGSDTESAALSS